MIRKALIVLALICLSACSAALEDEDCPRRGGVGGTGGCSSSDTV